MTYLAMPINEHATIVLVTQEWMVPPVPEDSLVAVCLWKIYSATLEIYLVVDLAVSEALVALEMTDR